MPTGALTMAEVIQNQGRLAFGPFEACACSMCGGFAISAYLKPIASGSYALCLPCPLPRSNIACFQSRHLSLAHM